MTTEVAILNRHAIALAADRKMSCVTKAGTRLNRDNHQKLFRLSEIHPVGIMINGSADYTDGTPWEVLIGEYVAYKRDAPHETIAQWGEDFLEFVQAFGNDGKDEAGERLGDVLEAMFERFEAVAAEQTEVVGLDFVEGFQFALAAKAAALAQADMVLTPAQIKMLKRRFTPVVKEVVANRKFCKASEQFFDEAKALAWQMLSRKDFSPRFYGHRHRRLRRAATLSGACRLRGRGIHRHDFQIVPNARA